MSKNAQLSDVCLSTSAAPTYFPVHYFETKDAQGKTRTFNLVDGGVAANNPVSRHSTYIVSARKLNYFRSICIDTTFLSPS